MDHHGSQRINDVDVMRIWFRGSTEKSPKENRIAGEAVSAVLMTDT